MIKDHLIYYPSDGEFTRLDGRKTGCMTSRGYITISVQGRQYYAHRLAWLYMTGEWPEHQIDHINECKHDNSWLNLREATRSENHQNLTTSQKNNKCGFLGVSKHGNGYAARIKINGKSIHLGQFWTKEEAAAAYLRAKDIIHPFSVIRRNLYES